MTELTNMLNSTRSTEKGILAETLRFIGSNVFKPEVRRTPHLREWFRCPMTYTRIIEIPLTLKLLNPCKTDRILDVSSPKLLALYLARRDFPNVVAADMDDYFVADFNVYRNRCGLQIDTSVFDATKNIPFTDDHFDKIFSISVLEHIPGPTDTSALTEMVRVLKPGGSLVITLPVFPKYIEEWTSDKKFYWPSVTNQEGRFFYQRRYDHEALGSRLSVAGATSRRPILIAERPLAESHLDATGKVLHNSHFIDRIPSSREIRKWGRRVKPLPLTGYLAERIASAKCHYLTDDWTDPNIRQVALEIVKDFSQRE